MIPSGLFGYGERFPITDSCETTNHSLTLSWLVQPCITQPSRNLILHKHKPLHQSLNRRPIKLECWQGMFRTWGLWQWAHRGFPISLVSSPRNGAKAHVHAHAPFQLHTWRSRVFSSTQCWHRFPVLTLPASPDLVNWGMEPGGINTSPVFY